MNQPLSVGLMLVLAFLSLAAGPGEPPLVDAIKRGDAAAIRALLQRRVDVNARAVDGSTALMWAVNRGDSRTVEQLIQAGADVNVANRFGMIPLAMAAEIGNPGIVEQLLKAGADPNTTLPGGETPFMTAARTGNPDVLWSMLAHGANVSAKEVTRDQTALMWAAAQGRTDAVKVLIEAGADIHARSTELKSYHLNTYIAGRKDADTSERLAMFTPLLFAARGGHLDVARVLLDAGGNANDAGPDGTSALHITIMNANWELAAVLVERGADVNAQSPGGTALHHIARARAGKYLMLNSVGIPGPEQTGSMTAMALVKLLLARGADPNARTEKQIGSMMYSHEKAGMTPLIQAQNPADAEYTRLLLEGGADPKLTGMDGTTVLMMAAGLGLKSLMDDNEEALENVKLFIEHGVDVNAKNADKDTALHGAAFRNYIPILQYLVEHGAQLDAKNHIGWTPLMHAHWNYGNGLLNTRREAAKFLSEQYEARGLPTTVPNREEAIEKLVESKGGPIIACPEAVTVKSPDGNPVVIEYSAATATTRGRAARQPMKLPATCTPSAGSAFPVGRTMVTCSVTDPNARTDSCTVLMKVLQ